MDEGSVFQGRLSVSLGESTQSGRCTSSARRCAVVAASEFNRNHFQRLYQQGLFDFVLAVDGGFAHLEACGVVPDAVIGDFDSLGYVPDACLSLVFPPEKDKSDLELAFDYLMARGFRDFTVYGALGGRLDHTLASLAVFAQVAERRLEGGPCSLRAVDEKSQLEVLSDSQEIAFSEKKRGTVSVFSANDKAQGVFEEGLKYPFPKGPLSNRTSLCLSNEFTGKPARIGVERGTIYVIHSIEQ